MKLNTRKIVKFSVIGLIAVGVIGTSATQANAKHRKYRYRHHRLSYYNKRTRRGYWKAYRKHGHIRYTWHRYKKRFKRIKKLRAVKRHRIHRTKVHKVYDHYLKQPSTLDGMDDVSQMRYQTFRNINKDRASYGQRSLRETQELHNVAQKRADQLARQNYLSHYDNKGHLAYVKEANRQKVRLGGYSGENIAGAGLGGIVMDKNPHVFVNNSGSDMANMDEDEMVNHDENSNWGHRYNMLNPHYTKVGVAVTQRAGTNNYYLAENFSD